jgi:hypothetical protein
VRQLSQELLQGAIDLHTHGFPEIHPDFGMAQDDIEMAEYARAAGMAGYVLKSHIWPTVDRAYHVRRHVQDILVVSSITLNSIVGGCNPGIVETAITQGIRAIWMPTWSAKNDLTHGGFSPVLRAELPGLIQACGSGISIIDDDGNLTGNARSVLRIAAAAEIVVSTGHISTAEALALAAYAEHIGFRRLVFTHPDVPAIGASESALTEFAGHGGYIEWTFGGMLPRSQRIHPSRIVELVGTLGADRCVMTTDTFGRGSLPMPDLFRMYIGTMLECGLSAADLRTMIVDNPRRLLGIADTDS